MNLKRISASLYFLLGFGVFMSTRYSNIIPSFDQAFLIAPVFILRFIRTQPKAKGIWLTLLGFLLSMNIALWGIFKIEDHSLMIIFNLVRSTLLALIWFLPFMIDRIIYPKFKELGIISTLTFPVVITAVFFLLTFDGPFDDGAGTTSTFSYGTIVFKQALSIFGVWSFVFLYSWLFAVINYIWEENFRWKNIKKLCIISSSVFLLVLLFGILKTSITNSDNREKVKIAAIVLLPENGNTVRMDQIFSEKITSPFKKTLNRIEELTSKAAKRGAKIATFQEFSIIINENNQNLLVEEFKRIAKENNIYLGIAYAYFAEIGKGENKHLFINNLGEIELDYSKRYLVGVGDYGENAVFENGPELIQATDTPYGKIGITICKDMGFPSFMRQAAQKNVDIILSPSYDWPKSNGPWYLASTIENGFSLIRPTYNGYTYAADYNGIVIAHMDSDRTENGIMYANVPMNGIKTFYPIVGDLLGWICLILMLVLIGYQIYLRRI